MYRFHKLLHTKKLRYQVRRRQGPHPAEQALHHAVEPLSLAQQQLRPHCLAEQLLLPGDFDYLILPGTYALSANDFPSRTNFGPTELSDKHTNTDASYKSAIMV